jgi:hypothetical protein
MASKASDTDSLAGRVPGAQSSDAEGGAQKTGSVSAKLNTDVQALRTMEAGLMEMAASYPTAVKSLRAAAEAIRSAQRQVISDPGSAEPKVPNTFG